MPTSPRLQQADLWRLDPLVADKILSLPTSDHLDICTQILPPSPRSQRGQGFALAYGFHPSAFGETLLVAHERGLVALGFVIGQDRAGALKDLQGRWPAADFAHRPELTEPFVQQIFASQNHAPQDNLKVLMLGSAFEIQVWKSLLDIPAGQTSTYSALAAKLGRPQAARAIGSAVGRNPLAVLIPCHRVVGRNGTLTGYHWGLACKQALLQWEAGLVRLKD